jgi:site-specific recombinase XerD
VVVGSNPTTPTIPNKLGKKSSHLKVSHTNAHHYFVVLANFFGWVVREGFLKESPTAKIRMARPKAKVIKPYTHMKLRVPIWTQKRNLPQLKHLSTPLVLRRFCNLL